MMFTLVPRPLLTGLLCGRGLGTSHVGKVRVRCFFTERKTEYVAHAKAVCAGPSPCFGGGGGGGVWV